MAEQNLKDKIKILHIVKDEKFFDPTIQNFEADDRLLNRSVMMVNSPNYTFKFIKKMDKVNLVYGEDALKKELAGDYDVVYFHSLQPVLYRLIDYIPADKIVIWWCWGFELYSTINGMKPLIPVALYQPLTRKYLSENINNRTKLKDFIKEYFVHYLWNNRRKKVLKRVDYFQPVLPLEYSLLKGNRYFRAGEFYSNKSLDGFCNVVCETPGTGNILFGNSSSYTSNHLDAWEQVKQYVQPESEVIVPMNYGFVDYADYFTEQASHSSVKVNVLRSFLPIEEYYSLINSCSYAVFGVLRQQAMGNIYYCIQCGMKVFLYRNSIVYKDMRQSGYIVFAIEDVDVDSFRVPLTEKQIAQNRDALRKDADYRNSIYEKVIDEIKQKKLKGNE
jgi:hypothetical protein